MPSAAGTVVSCLSENRRNEAASVRTAEYRLTVFVVQVEKTRMNKAGRATPRMTDSPSEFLNDIQENDPPPEVDVRGIHAVITIEERKIRVKCVLHTDRKPPA